MYPQTSNNNRLLYAGSLCLIVLLFVWAVYSTVSTIHSANTTGTLVLTTNDSSATLSISQFKSQAQILGAGSVKVRLPAGTYEVAAFAGGHNTLSSVTVAAKNTTTKTITLSKTTINPDIMNLFGILPFLGPSSEYQISYTTLTTPSGIQYTIVITSGSDQAKADALAWIRDQGYNPSDYTISYVNQALVNYHYVEGGP